MLICSICVCFVQLYFVICVFIKISFNLLVALLKVAENVTLNEDVVPACQPVAGNTYVGDICQVSGWGTVEWGEIPTLPPLF